MTEQGQPSAGTALTEGLRAVLSEVPALILVLRGPDLVCEIANARQPGLAQGERVIGMTLEQMLEYALAEEADRHLYLRLMREAATSGETVHRLESPAIFRGAPGETYWDVVLVPLRDDDAGGLVVHATDVTRLVEARRRAEGAEQRFLTLFEANSTGVTITDRDEILEANDAFLSMIGRTRQDLAAGLNWTDLTAPESIEADERALAELMRYGAATPYEKEYIHADGSRVAALISGSRLRADPLQVIATTFELTERKRVEREIAELLEREREARTRAARLQEVTASLSASNSPDEIARAVIHHAVEDLSASGGLLARGAPGDLRVAHAVGFPREQVEQWRRYPAMLPGVLDEAVTAGDAIIVPDASEVAARAPELGGAGMVAAVPLIVADRVLGALALTFRSQPAPSPEDTEFLLALARQAATALDRARLYENRAYVARKLQEGLLPQHLAEIPGVEVAAVYESISGGGEVGGDFYDVFETAPSRWAVVVGDVCGKGTDAAVVTGLARHTIRAVARMADSPGAVLDFLNGALRRHAGLPAFCTVGCALFEADPSDGGVTVRASSGGHPYPLVLHPDGTLDEIEVIGTMLGVADDPELEDVPVHVGPGDALVLYTDGIVDAREHGSERFGEARLFAALRHAAGGTAGEIAAAVEAAVRAHHPGQSADDRAIVVLRVTP